MKPLPFSQDDVNRAIERLTSVLEDEFGNDIAAWGSATLVLLCSIIAPPQRDEASAKAAEWVGLTDEEIVRLRHLYDPTAHWSLDMFARAIEAKLKEKNT